MTTIRTRSGRFLATLAGLTLALSLAAATPASAATRCVEIHVGPIYQVECVG